MPTPTHLPLQFITRKDAVTRRSQSRATISCCAPFLLALSLPRNAAADDWWGRDKALHFGVSVGMSSATYAIAAPITSRREYRVMIAAGTSLAIGAAKEGYDALGYGDPSIRDFVWDIAGTAVGTAIAFAVDCLVSGGSTQVEPSGAASSPIMVRF